MTEWEMFTHLQLSAPVRVLEGKALQQTEVLLKKFAFHVKRNIKSNNNQFFWEHFIKSGVFLYYLQEGNPFDATAGYRNLTYEEVLQELVKHKEQLKKKDSHIRELEDYIDNLLVRVMEETPSILRVPYEPSRKAGKFSKS